MADTVIKIGGDVRELQNALKKGEREIVSFGGKVGGSVRTQFADIGNSIAGAFAATAIIAKIKSTVDHFGEIADLAARLNTSAESIQKLDLIGAPSGASAESLVNALSRVTRALGDVENSAAKDALETLGINMQKLADATPEEQIMLLAQGFQEAQTKGKGFNEIYDLLGKSAGELIPVLRTSREELRKLSETPVLSAEQVDQLDEVGDRLTSLNQQLTIGLGGSLAGLGDIIISVSEEVSIMDSVLKVFSQNLAEGDNFEQARRKAAAFDDQLREINAQQDKLAKPRPVQPIVTPQAKPQEGRDSGGDQIGAMRTLAEELQLLTAKATGNEKIIDQVTREIELNRRVHQVMKETGATRSEAVALAKQMQALEEQAERKENRKNGVQNKIKGGRPSDSFKGLREHYDKQGKPIEISTPGLDRHDKLQDRPKGLDFGRRIPIGKGFENTKADPLEAQARKAAAEASRNDSGNAPDIAALLKQIADNTRPLADLD